jgi:glycosyltransferase involved in cell wall biosynthesis
MRISIALCTYNGSKYLLRQLDSYLSQTRLPDELVVCDDLSIDESPGIVKAFARRAPFRVKLFVNDTRLNYTENFIKAIGLCSGDVIATSDQDDLWLPKKLEQVTAEFADKTVTAVIHPLQVTDEYLVPSELIIPPIPHYGKVSPLAQELWFSVGGLALTFRSLAVQPFIGRARTLSKWGRGPAPFDEWVYLLASMQGNVFILRDPLVLYRRHQTAATGDPHVAFSGRFQRRLGWAAGSEQYIHLSEVAASRAQLADVIEQETHLHSKSLVHAVGRYYRSVANFYKKRALLYEKGAGLARRVRYWCDLLLRGGYRSRLRGALGVKSMVKDACLGLLG